MDDEKQILRQALQIGLAALGRKPEPEPEPQEQDLQALIDAAIEEVMADTSEPASYSYELPWKYRSGTTDPYPILRALMERKGLWAAWAAERNAILEQSLDDGKHYLEYKRLVELCQKNIYEDPDCMLLAAEWYRDGLTVSDGIAERTLVEEDIDKAGKMKEMESILRDYIGKNDRE